MLTFFLMLVMAYLLGSISSAILVCRLMRLPDPRTQGSKNPGATNVLRLGGKKLALLVLFGDLLKGVIPVLVAASLGVKDFQLAMVGVAAFLGHLYPIFFEFKGGKGVATALGVIIALSWQLSVVLIITWIIVMSLTRYSSLSSLIAAAIAPFYCLLFGNESYFLPLLAMYILLFFRHQENIKKLRAGTESKIKF